MNHDIVAIGGSAGALNVILGLTRALTPDIAGSIFIAIHRSPEAASLLPEILSRTSTWPATHPLHGEKIKRGHIYVAPPDMHLMLRPGSMEIVRGPKENGHRPAVDALFRTAAASYRSRVIGVVLSGHQDCGTAGMLSIKARGGVSVVQDPLSSEVAEMPQSVITHVEVDHVVEPNELAALIARLVASPVGPDNEPDPLIQTLEGTLRGRAAELGCPLCQGTLTEVDASSVNAFRCHVGHAFSLSSLAREQADELERALWAAVRALEESAALSLRFGTRNVGDVQRRFVEKSRTQLREADVIREILLRGDRLVEGDAAKVSGD